MSSIDDRIVDMQFNNASFEKNVGTSIKSLENLNKALELKDASKGLDNVMVAVKAIDLSSMVDGVQSIAGKFNIVGAVGLSVINQLTSALMGFAGSSIDAIVDPLVEGGKRRAQNIEQAKFMIQGLGKSWNKLYKDMDFAVSGTAFGLDAAAKAASQLSASGVKAGNDMKAALRGISGVAAMTNSSYDDIAEVFTTVAGNGRVMASELNRISARGLNAAQALVEFYNQGRKGAKLTEHDIRDMVSKGKVSFADFSKAMNNAFGEQATKANETYAGSLSNVNAALSRIGEKFATPVYEKQRVIFNQLRLVINGVASALGPLITLWGDAQKAMGKGWVEILKNAEQSIGVLSNSPNSMYAKQIEAYKKYQAALDKAKRKGTKKPEKTAEIKEAEKVYKHQQKLLDAQADAEKKLDKAEAKYKANKSKRNKASLDEAQKALDAATKAAGTQQQATDFTKAIQVTADALRILGSTAAKVFGPIKEAWAEAFPKDSNAKSIILTLAEAFKNFADWLQPSNEQLAVFKTLMVGFFNIVKLVGTVVGVVFASIPGAIQVAVKVFSLLGAVLKPVIDFVKQLGTSFMGMFKSTEAGSDVIKSVGDALAWLRENGLGALLGLLDRATKAITDFWNGMNSGDGKNMFAGFDPFSGLLDKLKGFGGTMSEFFSNAWNWAKGIYESIKNAMSELGSGTDGFFSNLGTILGKIGAELPKIFGDVKKSLSDFFANIDWSTLLAGLSSGVFITMATKAVKGILGVFDTLDDVSDFVNKMKKGLVDGLDAFNGAMGRFLQETKSDKILKISVALGIFALAIYVLAKAFIELSKVKIEDTGSAVIGMLTSLSVLAGGLWGLSKLAGSKDTVKMGALAGALILLGGSLLILAKAAQIMGSVEPERLGPAMMALSIGLYAMIQSLAVLSEMDPKKMLAGALGMQMLAGALIIMAGAIALLGLMPLDVLIQGGIAVAALIVLLTVFAAIPSDNVLKAGIAVGIMAQSLLAMTAAIAILGNMDLMTLVQGGVALALMLAALVVAVNMMKGAGEGAAALAAMAVALVLLTIPIKVFAGMDTNKLAQGIGATILMLIGLVGAANMMQKAVPGAAAMIAMAIAIGILSAAVWVLAQVPADQLDAAVRTIVIALGALILAALAASAGPVTAGLFILAGAILAMGLAVALAGAGIIMFSIGLAGMGAGLLAMIPGMKAFGAAAVEMVPQLLAMVGLAVALAALAVAVAALGVGLILLGTGLVLVGSGLAIMAAVGGLGAIAVMAVWKALEPLVWSIPQIGLLGGAFLALGGGLVVLGAGLALTGVGLVAVAIGMGLMIAAGFGTAAAIDSVREALERFTPITAQLTPLATGMTDFGNAAITVRDALVGIDTALSNASAGFKSFTDSASTMSSSFSSIPGEITRMTSTAQTQLTALVAVFKSAAGNLGTTVRALGTAVQNGSGSLSKAMVQMAADVGSFGSKLSANTPKITAAIVVMVAAWSSSLKSELSKMSSSVGSSAETVGKNVLSGFLRGVADPNNRVGAAARAMARRFIDAMKAEFDIHSPSKVMEDLGKYVKEGFYKGLTGFEDAPLTRVQQAVSDMKDQLKTAVDQASEDIKSAQSKVNKLNKKKKKSKKDKANLKKAKQDLADAKKVKENSEEALKQLDGALKAQEDQLDAVSAQYDEVVEKVKDATSALADAQKEMADAQKSYTEQFSKLPELPDEGDLVNTYLDDIQAQIDATKKFAESLAYIRSLGLDDKTYSKLLEKGVDAQPFIDALIESGQAGVDQINQLDTELGDVASALGTTAAKEMYQNGVDMAAGLLKGLQDQEAALKAEMETLGNAIVDAIKKQLGIKSPSRVFAEVGGYSMLGLMGGMQKYIPALENTAQDVGDTAVDGLRKAIDEIGESVYGEMDMTPVIRPVLDLTDVETSAKQLGNVLGSSSLNVGSTYSRASDIALAARARELLLEQQGSSALDANDSVTFIQNNNSPKALSNIEIYRQTRNQLSDIKKGLPK